MSDIKSRDPEILQPKEELNHIFQCRTNTGMGNMIGNVTMVIRNFIKGLFPSDFFQDEFIDTQFAQNEMEEMVTKKRKPCLVIRPKVVIDDDTLFQKLPDWCNTNYFVYKKLKGNYLPVLYDPDNQIYVYSNCDRIKLTFDIEIVLDTKIQQINTAYFLKGSVLHKSYFYLDNTRLEAEIPKYYMRQISDILGYNLKDIAERADFNKYLNDHSQDRITEKVKLGSGNYSHFYMFSSNILCLFEGNPDIDDGESQGQTFNNFKVSENLSIECWCPMTYFLEVGRKFKILKVETNDISILSANKDTVVYNYTTYFKIPNIYKDVYKFFNKTMVITDNDYRRDVVDITSLFNKTDLELIEYANKKHIDMNEIFHIDLYLDETIVDEKSIYVDWKKFEITNVHPKPNDCYTLVVYKNYEKYNRLQEKQDREYKRTYN